MPILNRIACTVKTNERFEYMSMTEEERQEVEKVAKENRISPYGKINNRGCDNLIRAIARQGTPVIQYLYSIHLDVIGLIEKGLALEAPKDMYK